MIDEIICGDCLTLMPEIPDHSIDMILCDLPVDLYDTVCYTVSVTNYINKEVLWTKRN